MTESDRLSVNEIKGRRGVMAKAYERNVKGHMKEHVSEQVTEKRLELYVHIPFCVRKCLYCDFLSGPAPAKRQEEYMRALSREVEEKSARYAERTVYSVYFGGGTPSVVSYPLMVKLLGGLKKWYHLEAGAEITMEINPGTVNEESLRAYLEAGINRLSIGLQSARNDELASLGRIHTYEQFTDAYYMAREIGYTNISVDMMSGLPGQDAVSWQDTMSRVTQLSPPPEHLSAYCLCIEEGTPFKKLFDEHRLDIPNEDTEAELYRMTADYLRHCGYQRYEISNYSRPGMCCRHNVGYWTRVDYAGFGVGAASMVDNVRFFNTRDMQIYMQDPLHCECGRQELTSAEQAEEYMFLGLRMMDGVSCRTFESLFGKSVDQVYGRVLEVHEAEGLLERYSGADGGERLRLTERGVSLSNYVMADFLDPEL